MHKRFRERHPSNSLQQPLRERDGLHHPRRRWSLDRSSFESVTEKRILVEIGPARHRASGGGIGAGRFGHEFRNIIIGRVLCALSPAHVPDRKGKYENFYRRYY